MEPLEHDRIDIGRIVYEALSAGLDPYPRKEGAGFEWTDPKAAEGAGKPFAVLKKLRIPALRRSFRGIVAAATELSVVRPRAPAIFPRMIRIRGGSRGPLPASAGRPAVNKQKSDFQAMVNLGTLALDAMGGDHGPEVVIPGAAISLVRHPQLSFIF